MLATFLWNIEVVWVSWVYIYQTFVLNNQTELYYLYFKLMQLIDVNFNWIFNTQYYNIWKIKLFSMYVNVAYGKQRRGAYEKLLVLCPPGGNVPGVGLTTDCIHLSSFSVVALVTGRGLTRPSLISLASRLLCICCIFYTLSSHWDLFFGRICWYELVDSYVVTVIKHASFLRTHLSTRTKT